MAVLVLLIDSNTRLAWPLRNRLARDGQLVSLAASADEGVELALRDSHDVVVVGLQDEAGLLACKQLRAASQSRICLLTAEASPGRIAEGFAAGADMVVGVPYDAVELSARIRALTRRTRSRWEENLPASLEVDAIELRLEDQSVYRNGLAVTLSATEFRLLAVLAQNAGRAVPHHRILAEVWGPGNATASRYLHNCISLLRRKLEADPRHPRLILNERGVGYRVCEEVLCRT
jgi:two-component system, OmpR family, KDP operon response regulator KdpE